MQEKSSDFVRLLFAFVCPPIGVFLQLGLSWLLLINCGLTVLGFIPGIIHAMWIIVQNEDKD